MIIIDSREKRPLWSGKNYKKAGLIVGDYTTEILHGVYHIERKSLHDLYNTIVRNNIRFMREFIRAKNNGIKLELVVEGTEDMFYGKKFPYGDELKCTEAALRRKIRGLVRGYSVVVYWCKNRQHAKITVQELLLAKEGFYKNWSK